MDAVFKPFGVKAIKKPWLTGQPSPCVFVKGPSGHAAGEADLYEEQHAHGDGGAQRQA